MSLELQKRVANTLQVEGCVFSDDALIFKRVDAEVLEVAGGHLQKWEKKASWYWGDYMVAYCNFQLAEEEAERKEAGKGPLDEIVRAEKLVRYSAEYAEIAGVEAVTLKLRKAVAAFFQPDTRVSGLDWEHHRVAKWGSGGDLAVAQDLLALAKAKGWKASKLKAHINATKRGEMEPDEPMPQMVLPMEYVEARRRATHDIARIDELSVDQAKALLAELAPVLAYAQALAQVAAHKAVGALPPAKESLPRAA